MSDAGQRRIPSQRASGRPSRPFPAPWVRDRRTGEKVRVPADEYQHLVYERICGHEMRVLNLYREADMPLPDVEDLALELEDYARPHLLRLLGELPRRVDPGSGERNPGHLHYSDTLETAAEAAARWVLARYDPYFTRRRAAAGGRKSKRRPVYSPGLLLGLEGQSVARQLAAVRKREPEISEPMIKKLRTRMRQARSKTAPLGGGVPSWPDSLTRPDLIGTDEWYEQMNDHGGLFFPEPRPGSCDDV